MLVYKLVKLHKGKIQIQSAENQGTCVRITFPKGNSHFHKAKFISPKTPDERLETIVTGDTPGLPDMEISRINSSLQRILIVEDNDDLRNYLVDMLRTGYNIQSCPNGKEALIIIREFNPDLVISDIMMPEMGGDELCATIKGDLEMSHIPVVLLTALGDEKHMLEGLEIGADAYITKPFSVGILKATIKNILTNRALLRRVYNSIEEEEQKFATLLEFINASETREDDETFKNAVDMLFEELEKTEPEHFAVRQYKKYKLAAGKTAKSILISCGARLAPFDIAELREIMSYDEMELDMMGDQRSALFVIISDTDDTFNFVVAMMYSQLFNLLCDRADDVHHGRLPYHVRILCDEFANIGQIPKFDKLIATIRSREISASIILQSQSQLKTIYKDAAETILGNCDTMLFLGGKESSTLKEISETLGKETIDLYNTSDTRGQSRSYGMNYQTTGKELMRRDELAVMDGNKCILQLRGVRPFFSDKYDITKHKRYKELSDYDKRNEFDVEAYMRHRMEVKLTRSEEFDLYVFSGDSLMEQENNENKEAEHVENPTT